MEKRPFPEFRSLEALKAAMRDKGVSRLYVKKLSPNDNSKNQVYLGGSFEVLNLLPFDNVIVDKSRKDSKRDRFKATLNLSWLTSQGKVAKAPNAQLILYPKYPEVRLSGFLSGCEVAPSDAMSGREVGRMLFLGIGLGGMILAHVTMPDNPVHREIEESETESQGVLLEIPLEADKAEDSKKILLRELLRIYKKGWLDSIRLDSKGNILPCKATNCGGYTLEAHLGITPNGYSEPDFLGWEVKQHKVNSFHKPLSGGPVTLMTPEPTGGIYKDHGVEEFIRSYGYSDRKGRPDRLNFGGIYRVGFESSLTGLRTVLEGFDPKTGKLDNIDGGLLLMAANGELAAQWSFSALLAIWNRKHAKAVYIPSEERKQPQKQYRFGHLVEIAEGTDFFRFIAAMAKGHIYLDPALKVEHASSGKPLIKRRNQFRIKLEQLHSLYHSFEQVNLLDSI